MKKHSKRLVSLLSVLALCINLFPVSVSADGYHFTSQPQDGNYDPATGSYQVVAVTDFTPVEFDLVLTERQYNYHDHSEHNVSMVIDKKYTPGTNVYSYPLKLSQSYYTSEDDKGYAVAHSFTYQVRAYYNSTDYILTDSFRVDQDDYKYLEQPRNYSYNTTENKIYITWETSFMPEFYQVQYYDDTSKAFKNIGETFAPVGNTKVQTYGISNQYRYKEIRVLSYYYVYDHFAEAYTHGIKTSDSVILGNTFDDNFMFVEQPVNGSYYTEPGHSEDPYDVLLKYRITCKTSFIPKKILIVHGVTYKDGEYSWTLDKTITNCTSKTFDYTAFVPDSDKAYRIVAYYDNTYFAISDEFTPNNNEFYFVEEPQDGTMEYHEDVDNSWYRVTWKFNNRPKRIEIYNYDQEKTIAYPWLWDEFYNITVPGHYAVIATYPNGTVIRRDFNVLGNLGFLKEPYGTYYTEQTNSSSGFGKLHYATTWKTNFDPIRVEIGHYEGKTWKVDKSYTDVSSAEKTVDNFIPLQGEEYYFRAYASEDCFATSNKFVESYSELYFSEGPESGMLDESGSFTANWNLTFHPSKIELYKYRESPYSHGAMDKVKNISKVGEPITISDLNDVGGYEIRAYITDDMYRSAYFAVTEPMEFTRQPKGGRLEDGDLTQLPYIVIDWAVNYEKTEWDSYQLYRKDSTGEFKLTTPLLEKDGKYYEIVAGEYFIRETRRIKTSMDNSVYISIDSKPFEILRYERFLDDATTDRKIYSPQANGGLINWNTNFNPLRLGVRKYLEDGGFEVTEFDDPTIKEFFLSEGKYQLFAYYGYGENDVVYSGDIIVEQFAFKSGPYFVWEDASGYPHHNTKDIHYGDTDIMYWDINATPVKQELYWIDEDDEEHVMQISNTVSAYYFQNTGSSETWGHHRYIVRAWFSDDPDDYIESSVAFVRLEGPAIRFDNFNGGSMGFDLRRLNAGRTPMKPVYAGKYGKCTIPQCGITPPNVGDFSQPSEAMMLDYWEINGGHYYEGDEITILNEVEAIPHWKPISFSLNYEIGDITEGETWYFYLNTMIQPYIPALWAHFGYFPGQSTMTYKENTDMDIKWYDYTNGCYWDSSSQEFTILDIPDTDVVGNRMRFVYGPTQAGEYRLEFWYCGSMVVSQDFTVRSKTIGGQHTYELTSPLDKEYDGYPVEFDPYKGLEVDGGKTSWAVLAKMGEASYEYREVVRKGKEEYTFPIEEAPVEIGEYQLVITEPDPDDKSGKLMIDAAVFPFEIIGASVTYTLVEAKEPTYTEEGNYEYYIGSDGYYYTLFEGEYIQIEENSWVIPMLDKTEVSIITVDINGIRTSSTVYAETYSSSDYTLPSGVYLDGYNFTGWTVNDVLYTTAEEASAAVAALVAEKPDDAITVKVVYEQKPETFNVTVENGTLADGTTGGSFQPGTSLKVTADPAPEGFKFDHWENNGQVASYNEKYPFHLPSKDITLKAVYIEAEKDVEKVGTAFIESVTTINGNKIAFVSKLAVPEGSTMLKAGVVANTEAALSGNELTAETAAFVRYDDTTCSNYLAFKYTWTKSKVSETDVWCVRSYLVYSDAEGVEHTIYGDMVRANLDGIITE